MTNNLPTEPAPRYPREDALRVAAQLVKAMKASCSRIIIAGSLRRRKVSVGDVEIVYIGKVQRQRSRKDMFLEEDVDLSEEAIADLEAGGVLAKRRTVNGNVTFGPKNKLMVHKATGTPVDLFATTEPSWWNYIVCRTGGAKNNIAICQAAKQRGWKWNPYGRGFSRPGLTRDMHSEREVFEFVGLDYLEPWERE